ncbi:porin family protein [Aliivibrio sp. S4TY2]|uniref:porin family protein n=1 Tax=unclassified Aliivibrio TaxID=2645654 RepID=UPI002377E6CD|nr:MULTISPECIES: porin family protein [unclassified Aliivibrio]MDD9158225.1 porin family protein [Aliivibrio sp. S4TY2]MDD9162140.1 porin family protein [Aliivibrio sp. S4TY1]MDD9166178.1 porin family protein [Aliivibrio sp. S4MY2]MDD9170176.1 porin family protein [Aliivibrio sp. S4MY4]MDD9187227.1 porin family protein [Aliivibrio sp. S4MY3]
MKKIALLFVLFSAFSNANDNISGFYLGGGVGATTFDDGGAFDYTGTTIDTDDSTIKFLGGYQFNRIVAVELQYTKYGDINVNHSIVKSTGFKGVDIESRSISLAANLGYTFDSGWRPFGIVGLGSLESSTDILGHSISETNTSFHYGIGVEYAPQALSGLAFRVAYEGDLFIEENVYQDYGYYSYSDDYAMNIGTLYAGVTYKF